IVDSKTRAPLEGATIISENGSFKTITDAGGYFYIPPQNRPLLFTIRHVGYSELKMQTSALSPQCPDLLMIPTVSALDAVVVHNIFTKGINKNLDGSIMLSTEGFGLLPGQVENDVLQISQALP